MKDRNFFRSLGDLALGKGFYIVLALCVTAVGVSGYYLLDAVTDPLQPTQSPQTVTVPVPEEEDPVLSPDPQPTRPVQLPQEVKLPEAEPTPEPKPAERAPEPAPAPKAAVPTVFTWPVKGEVMRGFSVETLSPDPTMGDWRTHAGLDVAARLGARVLCMTSGTVTDIWEDEKLGTCIRVEHGGELESVYANLAAQPTVKVGDPMEIGAILGAVGDTAGAESAMAPHLHLEVFRAGKAIDPQELLPK